jgi:hypothetical protein
VGRRTFFDAAKKIRREARRIFPEISAIGAGYFDLAP